MEYLNLLMYWIFGKGLKISFIIIGAFAFNLIIQSIINNFVRKKINLKEGPKKRAETITSILGTTTKFLVSTITILLILPEFGVNVTALVAGVGVLTLAFGMASREIIADFLSGFFIIMENQYNIGDRVKIMGIEGEIKEITLRKTIIESDDGLIHLIPNGQIKSVSIKKD